MVGPALGVVGATISPTAWVLVGVVMVGGLAAIVCGWPTRCCAQKPPTGPTADSRDAGTGSVPRSAWFPPGPGRCAAAAAATMVLSGTDVAVVAVLRDLRAAALIGPVLAAWGLGSIVGGLVYGALRRPFSPFVLLGGLSLATIPIALAAERVAAGRAGVPAGLLCAPTITATVDQVSQVVPEAARGEAMGWHGSSMTAGSALGAPVAGLAIDRWGWGGGFVSVSVLGLAVAVVGAAATRSRRRTQARRRRRTALRRPPGQRRRPAGGRRPAGRPGGPPAVRRPSR